MDTSAEPAMKQIDPKTLFRQKVDLAALGLETGFEAMPEAEQIGRAHV